MEFMYFLLAIALLAIGLSWFFMRGARSKRRKAKPNSSRTPHYLHRPGAHTVLHQHQASHADHSRDIWKTRRQHAGEEVRGSSFTASRVRSDDEPVEQHDEDFSMTPIEYTPEEQPRSLRRK